MNEHRNAGDTGPLNVGDKVRVTGDYFCGHHGRVVEVLAEVVTRKGVEKLRSPEYELQLENGLRCGPFKRSELKGAAI